MKQMFAISHGEYSDYRVCAVFEDEATAKAWCEAMNAPPETDDDWQSRDFRIETIDLVEAGTVPFRVTEYTQMAELWDNGTVQIRDIQSNTGWPISNYSGIPPSRPSVRYVRAPWHDGKGGRLEVRGDSADKVAKVAGEKIAMWKAGAWGGPKHEEIIEETR